MQVISKNNNDKINCSRFYFEKTKSLKSFTVLPCLVVLKFLALKKIVKIHEMSVKGSNFLMVMSTLLSKVNQ